ncbi:Hypothetical Protein FCC1311_100122 [Hondaea fermentalgiana]|uniref:Uncharacterized protein n=1 Tax=Hondaea fermentalgiana TaxID=2315210 RepID=A0A2R5GTZ2_9STRA|nr:Hypothetical Protein FCC1311_100122 [Hondaea fermentalgiana]|eukprot:GBG33789.1 Hypothetical Protein FCC1311_100122 [Hondaea fermentalgiana]
MAGADSRSDGAKAKMTRTLAPSAKGAPATATKARSNPASEGASSWGSKNNARNHYHDAADGTSVANVGSLFRCLGTTCHSKVEFSKRTN